MTTATKTPMDRWETLPWRTIQRNVFKVQKRIYQASQRDDVKAVRKFQRLLMSSRSAKLLAVRKVTQDNRGKGTAGVDGVTQLLEKPGAFVVRLSKKVAKIVHCGEPRIDEGRWSKPPAAFFFGK